LTLAFVGIAPLLLGVAVIWAAPVVLEMAGRPWTWADLPTLFIIGLPLTPSVILAGIGVVSLIGRAYRIPRKSSGRPGPGRAAR
jgi:hypothetical protein